MTKLNKLSEKVLQALANGTRVKDIPHMYPVSLDQAKRLSRYFKYAYTRETAYAPRINCQIRIHWNEGTPSLPSV